MTLLFFALPTLFLWLLWVAVCREWRKDRWNQQAANLREIRQHERNILECWHKTPKHYDLQP